jgi:hypothetical protein
MLSINPKSKLYTVTHPNPKDIIIWSETLKDVHSLGDLREHLRKILQSVLQKEDVRGEERTGVGQHPGLCEHSNEGTH